MLAKSRCVKHAPLVEKQASPRLHCMFALLHFPFSMESSCWTVGAVRE